ncbi:acyl-CoA N-acyltransferase [Paraphysoderma sedebokerense]|nr:acyl-CoA N-acyltransferase [Paraphysoderma sedebokerense]
MSDKKKEKIPTKESEENHDFDDDAEKKSKSVEELMKKLALQQALMGRDVQILNSLPKDHKFWKTQPVPQTPDEIKEPTGDGPIEPNKTKEEIRPNPLPLPKEFEWVDVDVDNVDETKELYELLSNHYVEDEDAMFRFAYSAEFLQWALKPPGWKTIWHIGVRVVATKKLVAFISGVPSDIRAHQHTNPMVVIDFLCVHKKLRSKRLAPVLIKEVTRRCNLEGIFQALYTAGVVLPGSLAKCRYYHRSLNPRKLVDVKFSSIPPRMNMNMMERLYKVPEKPYIPGIRPMKSADVEIVHKALNNYLRRFALAPVFTVEEVRHWFLPIEGVIYSYVVEDPKTSKITDFISFYNIPSSVMKHPVHNKIDCAYLFYYFVNQNRDNESQDSGKSKDESESNTDKESLKALVQNALILAKKNSFDVFNCLELMENGEFLQELKFGPGDGHLNYYLYNWRCKGFEGNQVGAVLL